MIHEDRKEVKAKGGKTRADEEEGVTKTDEEEEVWSIGHGGEKYTGFLEEKKKAYRWENRKEETRLRDE